MSLPLIAALLLAAAPAAPARSERLKTAIEETRFVHGAPPHGVPGPWVLAGWRIGADALRRLHLTRADAFELEVIHRALPEVRYTCVADGLMASTGVSPGKLNLKLEPVASEDALETVITAKKQKRRLIYRLTAAFRDRIRPVPFADFPRAALLVDQTADADMFTVEEQTL